MTTTTRIHHIHQARALAEIRAQADLVLSVADQLHRLADDLADEWHTSAEPGSVVADPMQTLLDRLAPLHRHGDVIVALSKAVGYV